MDIGLSLSAAPILVAVLWTSRQVVDFTTDTSCKILFDLKYEARKFTIVL
jgi:hypothetical protein